MGPDKISRDALEEKVMALLEDAANMNLNLSDDDSDYGIAYIAKKLALCGTYMERLSDIEMKLVKIKLAVSKQLASMRVLLRIQEDERKASAEYVEVAREARSHWLQTSLQELRQANEDWTYLNRVVCDVREAVVRRIQDVKRLDSDIRLHQKLLEAKVAAGATSPGSYTGSKATAAGELDID